MNRIQKRFDALRARGRKALISFVTAGDPDPSVTVPLMHALVGAGADMIELGVPFSDPMADGPVIQRASERALAKHVNVTRVLSMVREFRERDEDTPVILMGYLNPYEVMGYETFAESAAEVGVDGILTVDLPPEEAEVFVNALRGRALDPIFLIAPTSDERRVARICQWASGFVYYVALKGVTGSSNLDVESVARKVSAIKAQTDLPVGVGFGIRDATSAAQIGRVSDAVVVGSALVQRIESVGHHEAKILETVPELIREMREALDEESMLAL